MSCRKSSQSRDAALACGTCGGKMSKRKVTSDGNHLQENPTGSKRIETRRTTLHTEKKHNRSLLFAQYDQNSTHRSITIRSNQRKSITILQITPSNSSLLTTYGSRSFISATSALYILRPRMQLATLCWRNFVSALQILRC